VWTDNPSDPHAFFYKASAVANGSPNYYVTREEDGGILIDPQEPGLRLNIIKDRRIDPGDQDSGWDKGV